MNFETVSLCRKTRKGDPLGFLKLPFAAKPEGGPLDDNKNFEKKVSQCRKKFKGGTL